MNKAIVIIPAYNEEGNITTVITGVREALHLPHILVINDYSSDKTSRVAKSMGTKVIDLPIKLNYGATIQTGFKYALQNGYDTVILLDGDNQHKPEYIPQMLEYVTNGDYDIVIGSRFVKKTGYKMPIVRRLGSVFFSWLVFAISGQHIYDPTSGYQVFNKRVLELYAGEYFPNDYPDADVVLMLLLRKMRVYEFPMEMNPSSGQSMHSNPIMSVYYALKMLVAMVVTVARVQSLKRKVWP